MHEGGHVLMRGLSTSLGLAWSALSGTQNTLRKYSFTSRILHFSITNMMICPSDTIFFSNSTTIPFLVFSKTVAARPFFIQIKNILFGTSMSDATTENSNL